MKLINNLIVGMVLATSLPVLAEVPKTFTDGDTLMADDINGNFSDLDSRVNTVERQGLQSSKGRMAYVWAGEPSNPSYTPSLYTYNSSGGSNTIARSSAGVYQVTFNGLGSGPVFIPGEIVVQKIVLPTFGGGHVQVTAHGDNTNFCKVTSWSTDPKVVVSVKCHDLSGNPADTAFTALFMW